MFGIEAPRLLGSAMLPRVDWEGVRAIGQTVGTAIKSACRLLGAVCTGAFGTLLISISVTAVRQPDSLLLQHAVERAMREHEALPESALAERDLCLVVMAIGAVILFFGLRAIEAWWHGTPSKE